MSDTLLRIWFSNAPFRGVKRVFFHRWVLWPIGSALAVGLPVALIGVAIDRMGLVLPGNLLSLPFLLWVALLAAASFVVAIPRFVVLGGSVAAIYLGLPGLGKRLAVWATTHKESPNSPPPPA